MSRQQREAADWAARLRGTPSDADREAFNVWHSKAGNAEAFAAAQDDIAFAGSLSRQRIEALSGSDRKVPVGRRWAFATLAAIGLALGFAWYQGREADTPQIAAGPMLPGQLRLADGSTVTLMDGAWAEPQFSASERRLRLHGGRARFAVAHDAARPFIVVAGPSETRALGTVFEVDARAPVPQIRLLKGSVEVRLAGSAKAIRLAPGERAEVTDAGPHLLPEMVRETMLVADNLPLGAVIEAASKSNAKPIRLADPGLAALPVTGRFDVSDGASLARKLAAALDLEAEEGDAAITLRKK